MIWLRRLAVPLVAAIIAGSIAGAIAWASIPDPSGVIHGCYKTAAPHNLVVIDNSTESCTATQTPITWNQIGPPGPAGPSASYSRQPPSKAINENSPILVGQLKIPAGNFELFARAVVSDLDQSGAGLVGECDLVAGGASDISHAPFNVAAVPGVSLGLGPIVSVSMQEPLTAAQNDGLVKLYCQSTGTKVTAGDIVVTAIKVGSLTATQG